MKVGHGEGGDENIKNGIEKTRWKARLEKIEAGIFVQKLPQNMVTFIIIQFRVHAQRTERRQYSFGICSHNMFVYGNIYICHE